jgi:tetratricopeptide (TPR) repeat protein
MRSILFLILVTSVVAISGQTVVAPDQKEAERLYRESIRESRFNKLYYDEYDKCRRLLREEKFKEAEASCERVIGHSENLPKESYLERHSGYVAVGIAQMRQQKFREAIANFERALEIAKPSLGDTDSETGDVYFPHWTGPPSER